MSEQKEYIEKGAAIRPFELGAEYWQDWDIVDTINAIPPADVRPVVRGEWERVGDGEYKCLACTAEVEVGEAYIAAMHFCPNCGADMKVEGNDGRPETI